MEKKKRSEMKTIFVEARIILKYEYIHILLEGAFSY